MGYKEMNVANVKDGGDVKTKAFEYQETLTGAGNGESVLVPDDIRNIVATVSFTAGAQGYIQATSDNIDTVKTGSPIWVTWGAGQVSVTTQDVAIPPTALRMVQVGTGTMKMTLRGQ